MLRYLLPASFVFLSIAASAQHVEECPHPEDSYPCYCEESGGLTTMHCNYLTESKQLRQALEGLTDRRITTLSVWKFDSGIIKKDDFQGPAINEIVFSHSVLNRESPPFVGQEPHLNRITFLSCFDDDDPVNTWSLGHLQNLKELTFEKNDIKVLENDWLSSSGPSLRSVTFDSCKIEKLEDEVFSKLGQLTTIFIVDNKIKQLSRSMFPRPAENLRSLSLGGNNIESLPDDIFQEMPNLAKIDLERNNIRTLSESVWTSKVGSLSIVYFDENPIHCDSELKWITKKSLPKMFSGACSSPSKLKGKLLNSLTSADFY